MCEDDACSVSLDSNCSDTPVSSVYLASSLSLLLSSYTKCLSFFGTLDQSGCCDLISFYFFVLPPQIPLQSSRSAPHTSNTLRSITRWGFLFSSSHSPFSFRSLLSVFESSVWPQCYNDINPNDRLSPAFYPRKHASQFITENFKIHRFLNIYPYIFFLLKGSC